MSSSPSTSDGAIGYFPLLQISKPNDPRGVPRNRWVYKYKAHALSVLQETLERRPATVPFMIALNGNGPVMPEPVHDGARPWLLVAEIPKGTPLAEVLKRHNFGPSGKNSFEEVFPAYYLKARAHIREVIELGRDDEWLAVEVQRQMQKV